MSITVTPKEVAAKIKKLLESDRDVVIGTGGMTGEGKSVFSIQLVKEYLKLMDRSFNFNIMTWERKELMRWIDGEGENKEGQLPEYSAIIPDELIGMFYSRSWYEEAQKDSVKTFNSCRDRHLLVIGSVPNFWELDGGFRSRVRFYVYIPERGTAWLFQQENNPFSKDAWNVVENCKLFRKNQKPYNSPNFVCEIKYNDLTPSENNDYKEVRNIKRLRMNDESKEKIEHYAKIKNQRDILIKALLSKGETQKIIGELIDMDQAYISLIKNGFR